MEKSATLNLRVNPTLKSDAETILIRLGIPMSTAVDMFLNQIVLVGGIPFSVTLPKATGRYRCFADDRVTVPCKTSAWIR